jgi:hypothetical protein
MLHVWLLLRACLQHLHSQAVAFAACGCMQTLTC